MASWIINELLQGFTVWPEVWSSDRLWYDDFKSDNVYCWTMHNQWVYLGIVNDSPSRSSVLEEIWSNDKKWYFDYKNNKID